MRTAAGYDWNLDEIHPLESDRQIRKKKKNILKTSLYIDKNRNLCDRFAKTIFLFHLSR